MRSPNVYSAQRLFITATFAGLLSACEEQPPPPPPPIVALPTVNQEDTHVKYEAVVKMRSDVTIGYQKYSNDSPGTLSFGLTLDLQPQADGQLWLEGRITYVQTTVPVGALVFTADTREPGTTMQDTANLEYELVHPGLKSPNHPFNANLQIFKALTEHPFQVQLNPNGSFAQLNNYANLEQLQPSLKKLNQKERHKREQEITELLNALAPQDFELLLCLMLPARENRLQDNAAQWQQPCMVNGEKKALTFNAKAQYVHSTPAFTYSSSALREFENGYYHFSYSGQLKAWLEHSDFTISRNRKHRQYLAGVGEQETSNTTKTIVAVSRVKPTLQNEAERPSNSLPN